MRWIKKSFAKSDGTLSVMTLWSMTVIVALQTNTNASGAEISAWLIVREIFFDGGRLNVSNH